MAPKPKQKVKPKTKAKAKAKTKVNRVKNKAPEISDLMKEIMGHGKEVGLEPEGGESEAAFQKRIVDTINALPDDGENSWESLPQATQIWCNSIIQTEKDDAKASTGTGSATPEKKETVAKAKAKAKAKAATSKPSDKGGKEWAEGSNAQNIFELIKNAGKSGTTIEAAVKEAKKKKIKTSNPEGRVKAIFREAVSRGIAKVDNAGVYKKA